MINQLEQGEDQQEMFVNCGDNVIFSIFLTSEQRMRSTQESAGMENDSYEHAVSLFTKTFSSCE